jgi:GDP-4-dehydro-6-deoxy-D-mannose reductase
MQKEKYLITGIGGFVARHILCSLDIPENKNVEIIGIDRGIGGVGFETEHCVCRPVSAELTEAAVLESVITQFQPQRVIHLAAVSSVSQSWREPAKCLSDNLTILLNLLQAVKNAKDENRSYSCRILAVGSSEVYDDGGEAALTETSPLKPQNPYAVSRSAQEELIRLYVENFGLDIVSTRSFLHIGRGQNERFAIASFVRQLLDAKREGKTDTVLRTGNVDLRRDISDVRDVVRAYFTLLEKGKAGEIYNICSGQAIPLREIIEKAADILGLNVKVEIMPELLRPNDTAVILGSNGKIHSQTGWQPHFTLEETLTDMIRQRS